MEINSNILQLHNSCSYIKNKNIPNKKLLLGIAWKKNIAKIFKYYTTTSICI